MTTCVITLRCASFQKLGLLFPDHVCFVLCPTHKISPGILQGVDLSVEEKNGMTSNAKT